MWWFGRKILVLGLGLFWGGLVWEVWIANSESLVVKICFGYSVLMYNVVVRSEWSLSFDLFQSHVGLYGYKAYNCT